MVKRNISTLHDVARIAGVSPGTVSRAITRPQLVAPKTLEKILGIIKKLHYFPDPAGRNLRSSKPTVVGAVIPKAGISTFAQTIADLNDALEAKNITLIVSQPETIIGPNFLKCLTIVLCPICYCGLLKN